MDTYVPATMMLLLEGFRQHFPAQHFAYFRGYIWALAMLGTTRKCMTNIARTCVFVDRHFVELGTLPGRVSLGSAWGQPDAGDPAAAAAGGQRLPLGRLVGGGGYHADSQGAGPDAGRPDMARSQRQPRPRSIAGRPSLGPPRRDLDWGKGYLCWPVLARLLPGQLNPLGFVAGPEGVQRLDFWAVVVALVRELRQYVGGRPLRVVADAYFSKASFLNPLLAEGITVISRLRKDAVGWDAPVPVVGQRPRGRPRKQGRVWKLATLLQGGSPSRR